MLKTTKLKFYNLNFGPQHPAAHGVLRLILELDGEVVNSADAHIGLLHRGTEKLIEYKNYIQVLPYFDRLDYVSMMAQEHAYCLVIEQLLMLTVPRRASYLRIIFSEITRILNHLLSISAHALDVGAFTPFLWAFEEREKLFEFYERVSGARMHAAYFRPGGIASDVPLGFFNDLKIFLLQIQSRIIEMEYLLTNNRIWRSRLVNVGRIYKKHVFSYGFSGVFLRSIGLPWDLRVVYPYELYSTLRFVVPLSIRGDCYDRYLIRIEEIKQSVNIIKQCLSLISSGLIKVNDHKYTNPKRKRMKSSMEALIHHFKYFISNFYIKAKSCYASIEAPKGEFGVFLMTRNTNKPYRCKIRPSGYNHLQAINYMGKRAMLADIVTIIGTQDIVFGEIDR
jgi:NADH dehydrogenase (ubiquinone) Fe-S protein 2